MQVKCGRVLPVLSHTFTPNAPRPPQADHPHPVHPLLDSPIPPHPILSAPRIPAPPPSLPTPTTTGTLNTEEKSITTTKLGKLAPRD